jgi:adenylate cyclase
MSVQQAASARQRREIELEATLSRLKLYSGLVLMTFVVMHLSNLCLALISLETAELAKPFFMAPWHNPVGLLALYGSLLTHAALALRALYHRRTLRMPAREWFQLGLGLSFPLLIAEHVMGTRGLSMVTGMQITYAFVAQALWVETPEVGIKQAIALVVVWAHGCIGLHFWLRYRDWYPRWMPLLLSAALLVPVLSLLALASAGRETEQAGAALFPPGMDRALIFKGIFWKERLTYTVVWAFMIAVAAVLAARFVRQRLAWRNQVEIRYGDGRIVRVPRGHSVLEASRIGGIPHYAVCGGKGRCSTCRVQVLTGLDEAPPPDQIERATLKRIHAPADVRLACQLRPERPMTVVPILSAGMAGEVQVAAGREREIAVLFCDIRGFTAISDSRLPYDTVFLLNRYFALVGRAVERAGGQMDKFIGDGAMALFGIDTDKEEACRQSLRAAALILDELRGLERDIAGEIPIPLRVAIGIHAGPAIVGSMGYGSVMHVTAIGDTVNIASRLETAAKDLDAAVVVSETVAALSGIDLGRFETREIDIRGSARALAVRVMPQGASLSLETGDTAVPA